MEDSNELGLFFDGSGLETPCSTVSAASSESDFSSEDDVAISTSSSPSPPASPLLPDDDFLQDFKYDDDDEGYLLQTLAMDLNDPQLLPDHDVADFLFASGIF